MAGQATVVSSRWVNCWAQRAYAFRTHVSAKASPSVPYSEISAWRHAMSSLRRRRNHPIR
jgi:hypothetical protein